MKPPPLLIGAALLFWGWQSGLLLAGALMAMVLEAPRLVKARWEFSDQDFSRIWTFCSLLFLAAAAYSFTANEGPTDFRDLFQNPNLQNQHNAGTAAARTAAALFRWLPMIFFLFLTAQAYSTREAIPLETVSRILRGRWRRARQLGEPVPPDRTMNVSYIYFGLCLFAASVHAGEDHSFFWGFGALLVWALWPHRSRRFHFAVWAAALVAAIGLSFLGQVALNRLARYAMNVNATWFSFFGRHGNRFDPNQSQTSLGQIGRLQNSGSIVIRLQTKGGSPPPLLRTASYRSYRNQTWYSELNEKNFEPVGSETNGTTWVLLPDKPNPVSVKIASYLEGGLDLLPLPSGCGRLENLSAYIVQKSPLGVVMVQGPGLVIFDALYGRGATIDAPPDTNDVQSIPPRETNALNRVVAELQLKGQSRAEAVRTLSGFFVNHFSYSTWQRPRGMRGSDETPLGRFLLTTRKGHCEYFATAGVLLLRSAGIPARYAVGYAVHEGAAGNFVVRQRDAHAWCLVWNERTKHWEDVDFTPGSWVEAEASRASRFQALADAWSRFKFELARLRWGQSHLRQYLIWTLLPALVVLLYQILFRRRRRRAAQPLAGAGSFLSLPGLDSEFYQLEGKLAEHGVVRQPGEALSAWLKRALAEPSLAGLKEPLQRLLSLHYRYRFDPRGLSPDEREALRRQAEACDQQIPKA